MGGIRNLDGFGERQKWTENLITIGNLRLEGLETQNLGLARQSVWTRLMLRGPSVLEFRSGTLRPPRGCGGFTRLRALRRAMVMKEWLVVLAKVTVWAVGMANLPANSHAARGLLDRRDSRYTSGLAFVPGKV